MALLKKIMLILIILYCFDGKIMRSKFCTPSNKPLFQQYGFTLFEVLIASTMIVIFCLSSYQIIYAVRQRIKQQTVVSTLMSNGIFLNQYFRQKMQAQSHLPCLTDFSKPTVKVIAYQALNHSWQAQVKRDSDVLQIGYCDDTFNQAAYETVLYFVAKTNRYTDHHEMIYGLYQKKSAGQREEILPGVAHLTIKYAIKNEDILAWHKVASEEVANNIQLILLNFELRSYEALGKKMVDWPIVVKVEAINDSNKGNKSAS